MFPPAPPRSFNDSAKTGGIIYTAARTSAPAARTSATLGASSKLFSVHSTLGYAGPAKTDKSFGVGGIRGAFKYLNHMLVFSQIWVPETQNGGIWIFFLEEAAFNGHRPWEGLPHPNNEVSFVPHLSDSELDIQELRWRLGTANEASEASETSKLHITQAKHLNLADTC